jgi:hypothetical protein
MRHRWHRLLCLLSIRNEFDYAPPFAPEVNHPYERDPVLECCQHCGGGRRHAIHSAPWDEKRTAEIDALREGKTAGQFLREWAQRGRQG